MSVEVKYVRNVYTGWYNKKRNTIYLNQRLKDPKFKDLHDIILKHELRHAKLKDKPVKDFLFEFVENFRTQLSPRTIIFVGKFHKEPLSYRHLIIFTPIILIYQVFVLLGYVIYKKITKKLNYF